MMFKGASIVTTAIFSRILVKMVIEKRHIAGCGLAILGLMVVGSSGFLSTDDKGESKFVNIHLFIGTGTSRLYFNANISNLQWISVRIRAKTFKKSYDSPFRDGGV